MLIFCESANDSKNVSYNAEFVANELQKTESKMNLGSVEFLFM